MAGSKLVISKPELASLALEHIGKDGRGDDDIRRSNQQDPHDVVVEERPIPVVTGHQVLVKIEAVGVCASDLHLTRRENPYLVPKGDIGGHEGIGRIAALGPDVDGNVWKQGDRVAVRWLYYVCQECELCQSDNEALCDKRVLASVDVNGCWAEYAISDSRYLLHVPEGVNPVEAAPILCAGTTVYRALKVSDIPKNGWVAIVGAGGGLGHLAIQYARLRQLKVLAIDIGEDKERLCKELGAQAFVDFASTQDMAAEVIRITEGGAHGVLVLSSSKKSYEDAIQYVRKCGVVCCVGLTPGKMTLPVGPDYFVAKGVRLIGTSLGTRKDTEEALDCLLRREVRTIVVPQKLEDVGKCLDMIERGESAGRFVLDLSG